MTEDNFWRDECDAIDVPPQRAVVVYRNRCGEIIIRQQAGWCDEDDAVVIITAENIPKLLAAITREAGSPLAPLALPAPTRRKARGPAIPSLPFE